MQHIATALAQLDPAARARTLHWLRQRFDGDVAPAAYAAAVPASPLRIVTSPVAGDDEGLSVDALDDLFDRRQVPAAAAPQTVTGLLSEFVTEFQNVARQWDDAIAAPPEQDGPPLRLSAAS